MMNRIVSKLSNCWGFETFVIFLIGAKLSCKYSVFGDRPEIISNHKQALRRKSEHLISGD